VRHQRPLPAVAVACKSLPITLRKGVRARNLKSTTRWESIPTQGCVAPEGLMTVQAFGEAIGNGLESPDRVAGPAGMSKEVAESQVRRPPL